VDLFGCANATRISGGRRRSAGSGDFVRNAYLSFLVMPSVTADGESTIVPQVSHVDYSEHAAKIVVTEEGLADLRGLDRLERAAALIDRCAHPSRRDDLLGAVSSSLPQNPRDAWGPCFAMRLNRSSVRRVFPPSAGH
jgi:acyl-CoA hydrolase